MKRLWATLAVILLLAGCSGGDNDGQDQSKANESRQAANTEATNDGETDDKDVKLLIKDVDIKIYDKRDVRIQGQAKTSNNKAYYRVLHDETIVEETRLDLGDGWTSFDIDVTIPEYVVDSGKVPVFEVYAKDDDGNEINPNYFAIDFVRQSF